MRFWAQNAFLAQKVILGAQSAILSKKITFELSRTHIPPADLKKRRGRSQKCEFWPKIAFIHAKLGIFALFATLGPKGRLLRKSALLRPHAADAYKTNGKLMKMEPLLAQKRFWAKKSISAPEIGFWAQKANFG